MARTTAAAAPELVKDPREEPERLLRDLQTRRTGLTTREARRRVVVYGPNELVRRHRTSWPGELMRQVTHPLALLLWLAAVLAVFSGSAVLAWAIVAVIVINALFAFFQERHAERAVEALSEYLPPHACVVRDGVRSNLPAVELVPGDVIELREGDGVCADARLLEGVVEVDLPLLSGGWQWGDDVEHGSLHTVWLQATTMSFLGIVACQIGTGLAARTQLASISKIGAFSNPLLLWGIAFEVAFAAAVVTIPPLQSVFDTAVPTWWQLAMLAPFPLIVLLADELWRWRMRSRAVVPVTGGPSDSAQAAAAATA